MVKRWLFFCLSVVLVLTCLYGLTTPSGCFPTPKEILEMPAASIFRDNRVAELVTAAEKGDVDRVKELAKQGVNVNAKGRYNTTPILRTVLAKNKEGYLTLLELGADPNVLDQNGFAAMNLVPEEADPVWLRQALAHGGNPNLENTGNPFYPGQTPLFFAIRERHRENVTMLIVAGSDVNHQSKKSGRPLDVAMSRSWEFVLLLLEGGAKYKYGQFDLTRWMGYDLRDKLQGMREEEKPWFHKTKEFLEKQGEEFKRPEK